MVKSGCYAEATIYNSHLTKLYLLLTWTCSSIYTNRISIINQLLIFGKKRIYLSKLYILLQLSDNDNDDDTSKKVVDYNINENQFAIEYTAIFEDGTSDSYIENKIIKRTAAERLPIWVEYIKKKEEKSKKEKSNK